MKIEHRKIDFEDERGTITDIFTNNPQDHGTIIYTKKDAVRGNHYHKKTIQTVFIVSGRLRTLTQKIGEKDIQETILEPNDLMIHEAYEAHTFIAEKDTIFLAFASGLRGGKDYEKDTYRLTKPLEDLINLI